jgi:hypothetical protein
MTIISLEKGNLLKRRGRINSTTKVHFMHSDFKKAVWFMVNYFNNNKNDKPKE